MTHVEKKPMTLGRPWTPEDDAELLARYPHENTQALADEWGRGYKAVIYRAHRLGVKKPPGYHAESGRKGGQATQDRRPWSTQLDDYILTHSQPPYSFSEDQLAADVGRTPSAVRDRLDFLLLGPPPIDVTQDKLALISELAAHIVSRRDMTPAKLTATIERVHSLRDMPDKYWRRVAGQPLQEWFKEVAA